jgi:hypothetical protein
MTDEPISEFSKKVAEQNAAGVKKLTPEQKRIAELSGNPRVIEESDLKILRNQKKKHGGKITSRMSGGQVAGAGYDD